MVSQPADLIDHIAITPDPATITAGATQAYAAQAFDLGNNYIGDVTSQTTFSIESAAGGSWEDSVYTSATAGNWTVTGTYSGLPGSPATASLTVNVGAAYRIAISPDSAAITAAAPKPTPPRLSMSATTAWAWSLTTPPSQYSLAPVAVGPPMSSTSATAGTWTVTGTYDVLSGTAILVVNAGPV